MEKRVAFICKERVLHLKEMYIQLTRVESKASESMPGTSRAEHLDGKEL